MWLLAMDTHSLSHRLLFPPGHHELHCLAVEQGHTLVLRRCMDPKTGVDTLPTGGVMIDESAGRPSESIQTPGEGGLREGEK